MSRRVAATEQGELQGAIAGMRSIATIVGPPFFTFVFAEVSSRGVTPSIGTPWFFGVALLAGAAFTAGRVLRREDGAPESQETAAQALANEATPV
jgi:DHA1 family tetracycline resistance protein-like MFS transporter